MGEKTNQRAEMRDYLRGSLVRGKGGLSPSPNFTAGLASLAYIFPVWSRFLPFFAHCRAWSEAIVILDDRSGAKRSRKTLNRVSSRNNGFVVTWRAWKLRDVNNLCSPAANGQPLFLLFLFYRTLDREKALSEIPRLTGTHPNGNRTLTS